MFYNITICETTMQAYQDSVEYKSFKLWPQTNTNTCIERNWGFFGQYSGLHLLSLWVKYAMQLRSVCYIGNKWVHLYSGKLPKKA